MATKEEMEKVEAGLWKRMEFCAGMSAEELQAVIRAFELVASKKRAITESIR